MRTRILPKMLNDEVESYLSRNDIIIVPVGTVEMHGGFPLDSETTISEAYALKMAEACDGLILTGLPYFYAGATASGRGTVQVSVREGIDYLMGIARSLLRQGFKRQIYISFHGPAHMTCSPVIRDFFDETGVPILYMDLTMQMLKNAKDLFETMDSFHAITAGAYKIMGRLEDIPLTTEYYHEDAQSCSRFDDIFGLAYQSAATGYYFAEKKDHMSTTAIPDEETREKLAQEGMQIIRQMVDRMDLPHVVEQMKELEEYNREVAKKCPWVPMNQKK
ncbi:MAG TPA: creatininase family protein [Candidatus Mediterraneibacter norfolkensis]|nr:creatininase family protein [Candidatus Mediterraneibacter norfolkensis]